MGGSTNNQTESFKVTTSLTAKSKPTKTGYTFTGWKVTTSTAGNWTSGKNYSAGESIGTGKYANATLTAQWSINSYTITLNVNDSNMGNVIGGGTYDYNSSVILCACPNSNYTFQYWIRASDSQKFTDNPLTITIPAQNETYTAVFGKALQGSGLCAVDVALVDSSNNIITITDTKVLGIVTFSGYSNQNITEIHFSVTPCSGYKFSHWAVMDNGTLTILKDSGGTAYKDCCDIPVSQIKDKVVIACFIQKTAQVGDDTNNV